MSKVKLQQLLSQKLGLNQPVFKLQKIGTKLAGSIISDTFRGRSDRVRQKMMRDMLDAELGADASMKEVGTLLAYTPEEWEMPSVVG